MTRQFDLIVLGSGPAGYSAAIRAAQLGARSIAVIENSAYGGTCTNSGCIPTKFLWETLNLGKKIRNAAHFGIDVPPPTLDFAKIQGKKSKIINTLSSGVRKLLESYAIELIEGKASFTAPYELNVIMNTDAPVALRAQKIIIATGSSPRSIPSLIVDHKRILDSTDVLNLAEIPKSMLIIGGGAIGIELATILAGFGSEIHLVEKENQLLPGEDPELSEEAKKTLLRQGIKVTVGIASLDEFTEKAEKILVAIGRKPNCDDLDLDKATIQYTPKGIAVNTHGETSQKGIFAAGDVTGQGYFAYTAQAEGILAAENALGNAITSQCPSLPRVVFSFPAIASVGAGENLRSPNTIAIGKFPFAANSKAFISGDRSGWVKIITAKETGRVLGGYIIGPDAENLIHIISVAIKTKSTIHDLCRESFFHPSLAETVYGACEDVLNRSVDLPRKKQ